MSEVNLEALHDAELTGVLFDPAREGVRLTFLLESGESRQLTLFGLKAFRCEDMTLQNVVSRLLRSSRGEVPSARLDFWVSWATSLSDSRSWLDEERKIEWLTACASGRLEMMVLEPSAGAQVVALCERIQLE